MSEHGVVTGPGTVRFERLLPGPIERVWAYLTEPEKRAKWLAGGPMELKAGGKVELRFHHADLSAEKTPPEKYRKVEGGVTAHGHVTRCEPPRVLAITWGDDTSEVVFELTPKGRNVLLVLTHRRLPSREEMQSVGGGWHSHLGILEDVLGEREPRPFWTNHTRNAAEYKARLADAEPAGGKP